MPLKNPYSLDPSNSHKVSGNVDAADYFYLKRLFPFHTGLTDKLVSTLYKNVIDELRTYGLDPDHSDHPAWNVGHPNHDLVERVVATISFTRVSGGFVGRPGARDDERAADGIREEASGATQQQPDTTGGVGERKRRSPRRKAETKKEG